MKKVEVGGGLMGGVERAGREGEEGGRLRVYKFTTLQGNSAEKCMRRQKFYVRLLVF